MDYWQIYLALLRGELVEMGGKGSGNWGHKGRKGKRGGSTPSKGGGPAILNYKMTKQGIFEGKLKGNNEFTIRAVAKNKLGINFSQRYTKDFVQGLNNAIDGTLKKTPKVNSATIELKFPITKNDISKVSNYLSKLSR